MHKAKASGDQYRILTIANQTFVDIAKREGFYSDDLATKVLEHGSVAGVDGVPQEWQKVFVTAPEIDPVWHVKMQAAFQSYTDNGVSKTINLPNSATRDDVRLACQNCIFNVMANRLQRNYHLPGWLKISAGFKCFLFFG